MTSSTGCSGLTRFGSPPSRAMPSRIAARSTTAGHAGEVLQQHAGGRERDLLLRRALHVPRRQRLDVGRLHEPAVLVAQQVLEQDLQRVRQARDLGESGRSAARAGCKSGRSARRPRARCACRSCSRSPSGDRTTNDWQRSTRTVDRRRIGTATQWRLRRTTLVVRTSCTICTESRHQRVRIGHN